MVRICLPEPMSPYSYRNNSLAIVPTPDRPQGGIELSRQDMRESLGVVAVEASLFAWNCIAALNRPAFKPIVSVNWSTLFDLIALTLGVPNNLGPLPHHHDLVPGEATPSSCSSYRMNLAVIKHDGTNAQCRSKNLYGIRRRGVIQTGRAAHGLA